MKDDQKTTQFTAEEKVEGPEQKARFVEPKLTFIAPKLVKHGSAAKITQGFFGDFGQSG